MFSRSLSLLVLCIYCSFHRGSSSVDFTTKCSADLIDQQYGYNISCQFNITATSSNIYHLALNWTLPSQSTFLFDNNGHFIGGQNPLNSYDGSRALATWDAINISNTAILTVYVQPNISITRNQIISSTATLQYSNTSDISQYPRSTLSVESQSFLLHSFSMISCLFLTQIRSKRKPLYFN